MTVISDAHVHYGRIFLDLENYFTKFVTEFEKQDTIN